MIKKNSISFYDWCKQTDNMGWIENWDYELNSISPREIGSRSHKKLYFKCSCGKHSSFLKELNTIVGCECKYKCPMCNLYSFSDWCIDHDSTEWLNNWDYELNGCSPEDIPKAYTKPVYFKCSRGLHKSDSKKPAHITKNINGRAANYRTYKCSKCNSFGQWCIDHGRLDLLKRWDCKKNKVSPFEVPHSALKEYYFHCPEHLHDSENKSISNLIKQEGTQACAQCNSFAQWALDNIGDDFFDTYWSDKNKCNPYKISRTGDKKLWFKCQDTDYHEDYDMSCSNFAAGKRCPYCSSRKLHIRDSLGTKYPEILEYWSSENHKTAYDYHPKSNKSVLFNCKKHGEFKGVICSVVENNFICPDCSRENTVSSYQDKVASHIRGLNLELKHELDCSIVPVNPKTNYHLPFDNEIVPLKLIIEVHGDQHYHSDGWNKLTAKKSNKTCEEVLEYQKWKDNYKKTYALSNGYHYLEIPYWTVDDETYTNLIDDKIKVIQALNKSA